MARVCPACHSVVRETANFCDRCGNPLVPASIESRAASLVIHQASAGAVAPGTCSACGYLNVPGEMFCQNCGVQLAPVASAPPPPPVPISHSQGPAPQTPAPDQCPSCGRLWEPGDVFCQYCGARLSTAVLARPQAPTEVQQKLVIKLVVGASQAQILLDMDRKEWLVGRSDPVRGIFPEVDLGPHGGEKSGVSRRHARLVTQSGQQWISDLNSTNFTFLNGQKLQPGELSPLKNGDEIRFGLLAVKYFEESAE